jgi:hypothetical protein
MITIISGSRRFTDPAIVEEAVKKSGFTVTEVIEGGQRTWNAEKTAIIGGIDYLAKQWALVNSIPFRTIKAKWGMYGRGAGPIWRFRMPILWVRWI